MACLCNQKWSKISLETKLGFLVHFTLTKILFEAIFYAA